MCCNSTPSRTHSTSTHLSTPTDDCSGGCELTQPHNISVHQQTIVTAAVKRSAGSTGVNLCCNSTPLIQPQHNTACSTTTAQSPHIVTLIQHMSQHKANTACGSTHHSIQPSYATQSPKANLHANIALPCRVFFWVVLYFCLAFLGVVVFLVWCLLFPFFCSSLPCFVIILSMCSH